MKQQTETAFTKGDEMKESQMIFFFQSQKLGQILRQLLGMELGSEFQKITAGGVYDDGEKRIPKSA